MGTVEIRFEEKNGEGRCKPAATTTGMSIKVMGSARRAL